MLAPIVGGDARCLSIAAASIVAKVIRDRLMTRCDGAFAGYGLASQRAIRPRRTNRRWKRSAPAGCTAAVFARVAARLAAE